MACTYNFQYSDFSFPRVGWTMKIRELTNLWLPMSQVENAYLRKQSTPNWDWTKADFRALIQPDSCR
jgi:hypothetical protein